MLIIEAEPIIGSSPEEAARDAVDLATRLQCIINLNWNGKIAVAGPNINPAGVVFQIKQLFATAFTEVSEQHQENWTSAALSEVSELPQPVQPKTEDCSVCRNLLKESADALKLAWNVLGVELGLKEGHPLIRQIEVTVSQISHFLADPQQVKTDPETARGESLLITLRDIRDLSDPVANLNRPFVHSTDRLKQIYQLVNDVLAKAEGR